MEFLALQIHSTPALHLSVCSYAAFAVNIRPTADKKDLRFFPLACALVEDQFAEQIPYR